ncbi:MAG: STAS domain-containing protein [Rhodospirillaceae bacterium]
MRKTSENAMAFQVSTAPGVTEIALSGRMTFADHETFREVMMIFDRPSGHEMVFDLSGLESVDSSGLGMFLIARDIAERKRLEFRLKGVPDGVRRVMALAKFERVIAIAEEGRGTQAVAVRVR